MFLIRNYVPNWTTTPSTIAPTTASIASSSRNPCGKYILDLIWIHTPLWHRFRPDSWRTLCYLYRVNKTLWRRKPLAVYTTTSRRRNNDHETMYQVCTYSFYSARDAQVNSWWVSVLLDYDASFLFCSSLTIFYTTMLRSSIFDREVDFVALVMLVIVVPKTAFSCSMIVIEHSLSREILGEREARTMRR